MSITAVFFLGLFVALVGVIPPGLLNISAAKISLKEGANRGIMFSIGVCVVVFIQTYIACIFAKFLHNNPDVVAILKRVAFVIFVLISVYFLFIAKASKDPKFPTKTKSKHSRFFQGMLLSALNIFPLPYQAYMVMTFAAFGWLNFEPTTIFSYVTGAATGTFVMLYIYIFFFNKIRKNKHTSQKNMNTTIGVITGVVALITLIDILKEL